MNAVRAIRALGPVDLRNITRDSLMRWFVLFPLGLALMFRWGVPVIGGSLANRFGFDLADYHLLIVSLVVMIAPSMAGMIIGFLLLDQRDDQTLAALQVTPLTASGFLAYRLALPTALSIPLTMLALPMTGLVPLGFLELLVVSLAAAPLAPCFALFLASFANNKVQGFALMKAAGVLNWPPLIAWFLPEIWQWVFGISPTFWPAKVLWLVAAGDLGQPKIWIVFVVGIAYQTLVAYLLLRRFATVVYR